MSQAEISFNVSTHDREVIHEIVIRAAGIARKAGVTYSAIDTTMDIVACHANGCRIKLDDLLKADDFNFTHDVFGIRRHLDRENGLLKNCFVPRFAA